MPHFAGPYEVDLDDLKDHDLGCDVEIKAQGAPIGSVLGFGSFPCFDPDDEQHDLPSLHQDAIDTALLFAAAPDLLAACEEALTLPLEAALGLAGGAYVARLLREAVAKVKGV